MESQSSLFPSCASVSPCVNGECWAKSSHNCISLETICNPNIIFVAANHFEKPKCGIHSGFSIKLAKVFYFSGMTQKKRISLIALPQLAAYWSQIAIGILFFVFNLFVNWWFHFCPEKIVLSMTWAGCSRDFQGGNLGGLLFSSAPVCEKYSNLSRGFRVSEAAFSHPRSIANSNGNYF